MCYMVEIVESEITLKICYCCYYYFSHLINIYLLSGVSRETCLYSINLATIII